MPRCVALHEMYANYATVRTAVCANEQGFPSSSQSTNWPHLHHHMHSAGVFSGSCKVVVSDRCAEESTTCMSEYPGLDNVTVENAIPRNG